MTIRNNRRDFLRLAAHGAAAAATLSVLPPSIQRALAIPAARTTGTIQDVEHIVILMQENRSFDHYFGTLRGVRGFADRHPLPLQGGQWVWNQSDGTREIPPFHFDTRTTSAAKTPGTPHNFPDAQGAWGQGKLDSWVKFKTATSMGYYKREDLPFQFALADAFTICDAYHCGIATGTDPNRILFWSGANANPDLRARGEDSTDADSEPVNLRCWVKGQLPEPGYTYAGTAFRWPTIPEVLQNAGVAWRIYQDPNDNWTGAMHGCLAFESFRTAKPGSPIYQRGMSHWSLEQLAEDVRQDRLPQVSWVLPPAEWSEHPASSPSQGAQFTARVLDALTSNPQVWSKTVFFLTFDENDGFFDHVPPPAVPSYNLDGSFAGKSTVDVRGEYFHDPTRKYIDPQDTVSGTRRPWGLGPRVPMYVVSPWSKGGWVNSQVFDHTSVGRFLEQRFGVRIPAISPWRRAVCGDLTSAFDFAAPNDPTVPRFPKVEAAAILQDAKSRPKPAPPTKAEGLFQEPGTRPSRALPYELSVDCRGMRNGKLALKFLNSGKVGAVFQVYDRLHLDRIPRRYTVDAGADLSDEWDVVAHDGGAYDLWIYGPNGFLRELKGRSGDAKQSALPGLYVSYDRSKRTLALTVRNAGRGSLELTVRSNAYRQEGPWTMSIDGGQQNRRKWSLADTGNWYDFTVKGAHFEFRFAGRMETGQASISDPAMAVGA